MKAVTTTGCIELPYLFSSQEKADTRLILHCMDLSDRCSRIIVKCHDTDELVLLLYYVSEGFMGASEVYMHAGHTSKHVNRQRYIPINKICAKL